MYITKVADKKNSLFYDEPITCVNINARLQGEQKAGNLKDQRTLLFTKDQITKYSLHYILGFGKESLDVDIILDYDNIIDSQSTINTKDISKFETKVEIIMPNWVVKDKAAPGSQQIVKFLKIGTLENDDEVFISFINHFIGLDTYEMHFFLWITAPIKAEEE